MKKREIIVLFNSMEKSRYFVEETLLPIAYTLKRKAGNIYEDEHTFVRLASVHNIDTLRGMNPDLAFVSDDIKTSEYNTFVHNILRGDHTRIKVVI